jgi:hypothetical protein
MSVVGSDGYISVYFVYGESEPQDLEKAHRRVFRSHDDFELKPDSHYVKTSFGNVSIGTEDAPAITDMSGIDNYTYSGKDNEWDLSYAPMVIYGLREGRYEFDRKGFDVPDNLEDHPIVRFADLIAKGYEATKQTPLAVFAKTPLHGSAISATGNPPFTAESLAHDEYEHLSWVTVFPPKMVDTYGRETLLSAPAWKTMELDDGAILLVTHEDPHDTDPDGLYEVADHIGLKSYSEA